MVLTFEEWEELFIESVKKAIVDRKFMNHHTSQKDTLQTLYGDFKSFYDSFKTLELDILGGHLYSQDIENLKSRFEKNIKALYPEKSSLINLKRRGPKRFHKNYIFEIWKWLVLNKTNKAEIYKFLKYFSSRDLIYKKLESFNVSQAELDFPTLMPASKIKKEEDIELELINGSIKTYLRSLCSDQFEKIPKIKNAKMKKIELLLKKGITTNPYVTWDEIRCQLEEGISIK